MNDNTPAPDAANENAAAAQQDPAAELAKAKSDKQCAVDSKFSSGRAVF